MFVPKFLQVSYTEKPNLRENSTNLFLAAMRSSRSDDVTQFVRSFVCSFVCSYPFFLLVSLEFVVHLECQKGDSRCLKGVSQVF